MPKPNDPTLSEKPVKVRDGSVLVKVLNGAHSFSIKDKTFQVNQGNMTAEVPAEYANELIGDTTRFAFVK